MIKAGSTKEIFMIKASEIRAYRKPGCYKWWATEDDFKFLATALGLVFNDIEHIIEHTIEGDIDLYCIYVGKGVDLLSRIVGKHMTGSVKNSTLRHSIGGIIHNQNSSHTLATDLEKEIGNFIDKLYVEPLPLDKAPQYNTKEEYEKDLINKKYGQKKEETYLRILNSTYAGNKHSKAKEFRQRLTSLRNAVYKKKKSNKNQSKQSKTTP